MRRHTAIFIGASLLAAAPPALAATAVYSFTGTGDLALYSYAYDYGSGTYIRPLVDRRIAGVAFSGTISVDLDALPANTPDYAYPTNYMSTAGNPKFLSSQLNASFGGVDYTVTTDGSSASLFQYSPFFGYVSELRDQEAGTNIPVLKFDGEGRLISSSNRSGSVSLGGVDFSSDFVNGIRIPLFEGLTGLVGASGGRTSVTETYAYPGGTLATYDYDSWFIVGGVDVTVTGVTFDPPPPPPPVPGVPEPSTWAMLIGGFFLLGMRLRRRAGNQTAGSYLHRAAAF